MNIYESDNLDDYILLLSSDWCASFLSVSLEISTEEMLMIKKAARVAVKHMMGSFDSNTKIYYEIDFSENRMEKTWDIFCSQLNSVALERKVSQFINNSLSDQYSEDNTVNTFLMLLEDFVENNQYDIKLDFLGEKELAITNIIRGFNNGDLDYHGDIAVASTTDWDKYLISIRPNMPTALSDFYDITIIEKSSFKKIWSEIKSILDDNEKKLLVTVLSEKYLELADDTCDLPNWL